MALLRIFGALLLVQAVACQPKAVPTVSTACIDPSKINPQGICTMDYNPVCGCDGKTYANACVAGNAGVVSFSPGPCPEKGK